MNISLNLKSTKSLRSENTASYSYMLNILYVFNKRIIIIGDFHFKTILTANALIRYRYMHISKSMTETMLLTLYVIQITLP